MSVKSYALAEVEVLLVAVVKDVPHLPHHAETPIDAHHLHPADAPVTAPEKMIVIREEVMAVPATTPLPAAVVVDV